MRLKLKQRIHIIFLFPVPMSYFIIFLNFYLNFHSFSSFSTFSFHLNIFTKGLAFFFIPVYLRLFVLEEELSLFLVEVHGAFSAPNLQTISKVLTEMQSVSNVHCVFQQRYDMRQGKGQYQGDKSGPKVTTNERLVPERLLLEVCKGMTYSDQKKRRGEVSQK